MNRESGALLTIALYLALCAITLRRHHARGRALAAAQPEGDPVLVAFASQTGFAEELAAQTAAALRAGGQAVRLASFEQVDRALLGAVSRALFVVSTTGEGDAPDSAERFRRAVMAAPGSLDGLAFGVLALGDRTYRQYCAFGFALHAWLHARSATPLFDVVDVDDGDAAALVRWRAHVAALGAATVAWQERPFSSWRLTERRLLNPGSPGGPAYHVVLKPDVGEAAAWQAGDVAQIVPGASDDPVAAADTRDYSIGSLPCDGRIELLVRQVRHADGRLGLGSGWLTCGAALGERIWLRVRTNSAFHAPDPARPLLLIGNGTGLAGLRAHLKARAAGGSRRNWLIFGERTSAHDRFHGDEIDGWASNGLLERCDRAFSRDASGPRYVQDVLRAETDALRTWIDDGAGVYVCGSRGGMAADVDAALRELLGEALVDGLFAEARYRRDVY